MNCKFKIIIASNINYYTKTFKKLIESLLLCGFEKSDIIFYISGDNSQYKKRTVTFIEGIKCIFVPFNSFEVTPLIDISINKKEFEYFFLLHDTCYAGPEFKAKISKFDPSFDITYIDKNIASMNIGMYSTENVIKQKEHLFTFYNEDLSPEGLGYIKDKIIHSSTLTNPYRLDDVLYEVTDRDKISFYKTNIEFTSKWGNHKPGEDTSLCIYHPGLSQTVYNIVSFVADYDFSQRIVEYKSNVDLYKIKGNWLHKEPKDYNIHI